MLGRQIPGTVREGQTGQLLNCTPWNFHSPTMTVIRNSMQLQASLTSVMILTALYRYSNADTSY